MIHNLKALGLAIFAVLALGAVGASLALAEEEKEQAHKFIAGAEPTHLTATQAAGTNNIHGEALGGAQEFQAVTNDAKVLRCTELEAFGTVKKEAESVTVTPTYKNCGAWETNAENKTVKVAAITVKFNGCHYVFKNNTTPTINGTKGYHATVEIECDKAGEKVEIFNPFGAACIKIGPQTVHGAKYFNETVEGHKNIVVHATAHGIVSETTGAIGCGVKGQVDSTGTYTGVATVKGYKDEKHTEQTDVSVSPGEVTP
jgi:hypothetical protein